MKYYIDKVNTWGPANAKCAKLHQEMKQYETRWVEPEKVAEWLNQRMIDEGIIKEEPEE